MSHMSWYCLHGSLKKRSSATGIGRKIKQQLREICVLRQHILSSMLHMLVHGGFFFYVSKVERGSNLLLTECNMMLP